MSSVQGGTVRTLTVKDFSDMLGEPESGFSRGAKDLIAQTDLRYEIISGEERDQIILDILKRIESSDLKVSGSHRKEDWEAGWSENLQGFVGRGDISELVPKYFKSSQILRIFRNYVRPLTDDFIFRFHSVFCRLIFEKYLSDVDSIWEFGCGTGHNLVLLSEMYPYKEIHGLDWASSAIDLIKNLSKKHANVRGRTFDMFNPDYELDIPSNSAVITIHSLEQLGTNYGSFLDFVLKKSPVLCINIEPVLELYDENNLLDYLAVMYHRKRGYLENYLNTLYRFEKEKKIEIKKVKRAFLGSTYDEGYSLMIWGR